MSTNRPAYRSRNSAASIAQRAEWPPSLMMIWVQLENVCRKTDSIARRKSSGRSFVRVIIATLQNVDPATGRAISLTGAPLSRPTALVTGSSSVSNRKGTGTRLSIHRLWDRSVLGQTYKIARFWRSNLRERQDRALLNTIAIPRSHADHPRMTSLVRYLPDHHRSISGRSSMQARQEKQKSITRRFERRPHFG